MRKVRAGGMWQLVSENGDVLVEVGTDDETGESNVYIFDESLDVNPGWPGT